MGKAKSGQTLRLLVILAVFGIAGAWVGYALGGSLKRSGGAPAPPAWQLLLIFPATLLAIAWHELGHLAGGWLSGFRLVLFIVGPLAIERLYGRLRFRFNKSLHLWGGLAASAPLDGLPRDPRFMRWALVRIVAGGPLFSLLGGGLLLPALLWFGWTTLAGSLLAMVGALSLCIALATLMPLATGGFRSDGARLLQMLRGGPEADRWAHLAILSGLSQTSRPRDWPTALVVACSGPGAPGFDAVSAAWMRALHHQDRGELSEARTWIGEALANQDHWPKPARAFLHATAAYLHALAGDAAEARRQLAAVEGAGFSVREQLLLAEAAVLLAEKRCTEAAAAAERGLRLIPPGATGPAEAAREAFAAIARDAASSLP